MLSPFERRLALRKLKNTSRFEGGKSLHSDTVAKSSLAFPSSSLSPAFKKLKLKSLHCVEGRNMLIWGTFPLWVFFFPRPVIAKIWMMIKREDGFLQGSGHPIVQGERRWIGWQLQSPNEAPWVCGLPRAEWFLMGLLCPPFRHLLLSSMLDSHVLQGLGLPPSQEGCVLKIIKCVRVGKLCRDWRWRLGPSS